MVWRETWHLDRPSRDGPSHSSLAAHALFAWSHFLFSLTIIICPAEFVRPTHPLADCRVLFYYLVAAARGRNRKEREKHSTWARQCKQHREVTFEGRDGHAPRSPAVGTSWTRVARTQQILELLCVALASYWRVWCCCYWWPWPDGHVVIVFARFRSVDCCLLLLLVVPVVVVVVVVVLLLIRRCSVSWRLFVGLLIMAVIVMMVVVMMMLMEIYSYV